MNCFRMLELLRQIEARLSPGEEKLALYEAIDELIRLWGLEDSAPDEQV